MTHEELEEAVPLYAIGALERSERQAIEAHPLRLRRLSCRLEGLSNRRFAAAVRTDARNAPEHAQSQDPDGPGIDHKPA